MSTDLKTIMWAHQLMIDIAKDPDLTGAGRLFCFCTAALIAQRAQDNRRSLKRSSWLEAVDEMAGSSSVKGFWVRNVIRDDVPRYVPEGFGANRGCSAPMIRREGLCGKGTYTAFVDRDPSTGAGRQVGYCTRHWSHEKDMERMRRHREWVENGEPSPAPNAGGVLRRYFSTDWEGLYAWAAPGQTPLEGEKPATLPRPTLSLIQGEG